MEVTQKFLVKPGKMAKKLKLKDSDADYDANKRKQDVERDLAHFSSRMSELQYKLLQIKPVPSDYPSGS